MSKKRSNLILVRHGLTDWNEQGRLLGRIDIRLNSRGRAEAERAAEALRRIPIGAVFSSPQPRTMETAEAVAGPHGLDVETDSGLDEVWLGRWQGKLVSELRGDPDLEKYMEDPTTICDAIEPASEVQERIVATAERCRSAADDGTTVLVSHGDPLRLVLAHYLSMELALFRRLELDTGSISILRFFSSRDARLLVFNWKSGGDALESFFLD
jgi:broad specificity phosphatase PhoE